MNFRGTAKVNPRIVELSKLYDLDARDMGTMTQAVDVQFRQHEQKLFASEGAEAGRKWPALSPAYARTKPRGKKIMQRSGTLRAGLVQKGHRDHVAEWHLGTRPRIEVGTRNAVAGYHIEARKQRDTLAHAHGQEQPYYDAIRRHLTSKLDRVARVLAAWGRVA